MIGGRLLGPYAEFLRLPQIKRLLACGLLAGMPVGMQPLAMLLLAHDATGSYGNASIVVAGTAVGTATISPLRGRAVDRRGAARVLPGFALAYAAAVGGLIAAAELGAPTPVLAVCGLACGGTVPPVNATLRTLLADRVPAERQQAAFGLMTLTGEAAFLTGPVIVGAVIALASPAVALGLMVAFTTTGTLGFATSRTARGHHGTPSPRGRFTVLATPGMRIVLASTVMWGATFGGLDVSLPAFADERGSAATGGVLLTALSLGVAIGTFVYGTRRSHRPVERRLLLASGVGAATFAPLALASETWQLALLVFAAGLAIAAPTVCTWLILAQVAPPSARTEAGTWISSAVAVGVAIGATAVGAIVDTVGARTALLAAFVSSSLGVVILLLRERELRPVVAT